MALRNTIFDFVLMGACLTLEPEQSNGTSTAQMQSLFSTAQKLRGGKKDIHVFHENAEGGEPERSVKSEKKRQESSHGKMVKLREKGRKSRGEKKD